MLSFIVFPRDLPRAISESEPMMRGARLAIWLLTASCASACVNLLPPGLYPMGDEPVS